MSKYTAADKVYTDNPMVDELVHNIKLILQDIVVKDQQEAEDNETKESITQADVYLAILEGKVLYSEFVYTKEIFEEMNEIIESDPNSELVPLTRKQIQIYTIDNTEVPQEYRSLLIEIASKHFLEDYEELNNYYRRLNGQKDIGDPDFFVGIEFIPPNYYNQFVFPEDLEHYDGTGKSKQEIRADMREFCIKFLKSTPITSFTEYQISLLDQLGIIDKLLDYYPELPYLRFLGIKKIPILQARRAQRFEILYLPDCENQIRARFHDIYDTTRVVYLKRYYSSAYKFENKYYDRFFILMLIMQVANDLLVEMPEYFISRTVFDNRTVQLLLEANGVKYFPEIPLKYQISLVRGLNTLIKYKSTTKNMYDIAALFFLKNITVYKYYIVKKRNIDADVLPTDYDGGGVDALEPPDGNKDLQTYQAWWKNPIYINMKCDYYYAGYDYSTGDQIPIIHYVCDGGDMREDLEFWTTLDGGTPIKSVNFVTAKDLDKMYSLFFVKVPVKDSIDNYLRNPINQYGYDLITLADPYWDGPNDHTYVKYEILKKNFTTQYTKYISLGNDYSMKDYMFQVTYFLNLLLNTNTNSDLLNLPVPIISASANFNIRDLIILLYCLSFKYYEHQTDDIIDLKNRDPRPPIHVDPSTDFGDFDPKILLDYNMDGGYSKNVGAYYKADGGGMLQKGLKPINLNGGHPINSICSIDFPETDEIIFREGSDVTDYNGMGPIEYLEIHDMDGGNSYTTVLDKYRLTCVLDGGYVVNSYLYTGKEEVPEDDPCVFYKEAIDKWRYPFVDLSDRILGFNMDADLDALREEIASINHPKFGWLRGYTLEEILPATTMPLYQEDLSQKESFPYPGEVGLYYLDIAGGKYRYYIWSQENNEYESIIPAEIPEVAYTINSDLYNSFPEVGKVGTLYLDMGSGNYYIWNIDTYTKLKHVYSKGIQDFKVIKNTDNIYENIEETLSIYETNKEIYENLMEAVHDCDTQDEMFIYEYVKDYLFTAKMDMSYFTLPNGKPATRYSEFLEDKDGILYAFYKNLISETNVDTRQYNMSTYIDQIIESINQYLSTDMLDYVFYFVPTLNWSVVLKYISLIVNFFKSYKTSIIDIASTMVFDNEEENALICGDNIAYHTTIYDKGDWSGIYDTIEMDKVFHKEDFAITDRQEDRVFINHTFGKSWVDINGGSPTIDYGMDIDANNGSRYPGFFGWNDIYQYYILDGGTARDITLDPEPDPVIYEEDYDPEIHGYNCDGRYERINGVRLNADGYTAPDNEDRITDVDGGIVSKQVWAPIDSPHFTGEPTVPTPPFTDASQRIANTEFVHGYMDTHLAPIGDAERHKENMFLYIDFAFDWIYIN